MLTIPHMVGILNSTMPDSYQKQIEANAEFVKIRKKFFAENDKRFKTVIRPRTEEEKKDNDGVIEFNRAETEKLFKELLDRKRNFFYSKGIYKDNDQLAKGIMHSGKPVSELYSFPLYVGKEKDVLKNRAMEIIYNAWHTQSSTGLNAHNKISDQTLAAVKCGIDYWHSGINNPNFELKVVKNGDDKATVFDSKFNSISFKPYKILIPSAVATYTPLSILIEVRNSLTFHDDISSFINDNGHFYIIGELFCDQISDNDNNISMGSNSLYIVDFKVDSLNYISYYSASYVDQKIL